MTVEENLHFYGKLFGVTDLEDRIASRLRRVGLRKGRSGGCHMV